MPELIEVESYRRAADRLVGSTIVAADVADPHYLRGGIDPRRFADDLTGAAVTRTDRRGKLALLVLDSGHALGLRFGMTGRLIVGSDVPIAKLEFGSGRDDPAWDRFSLWVEGGPTSGFEQPMRLRINDPRRLGSVELDPDLARLGPNAEDITAAELRRAMRGRRPVKGVLLDQSRVAGLGNLLCDEILWRCGIDPAGSAEALALEDLARLRNAMVRTIVDLTERGGSHRGDLQDHRCPGGACPRDGEALRRRTVAGRTTYSCPSHQR